MSSSKIFAPVALALLAAAPAWSAQVSATLGQKASCRVNLTTSGCSNNPGPYITINGEMDLGGVKAKIILSNNAKLTHVASTDVVADVDLIPEGDAIKIAKQPSRGGVGGNPWIYVALVGADGAALSDEVLVGRCNDLM